MGVGLFLLILLGGGFLVVLGVAAFASWSEDRNSLNSAQKKELASLRLLVKQINAEAHKYQELEPNFTSVTIDKISNHYQKELES
jgi:membrane peptidoglycan carboxypeptidase